MKKTAHFAFTLLVFFLLNSIAGAQQADKNISPEARDYLEKALDIMQEKSFRRKEIDWNDLRKKTIEKARGAEETIDTWRAIRFALKKVNKHSFLQLSEEEINREKTRVKDGFEEDSDDKSTLSPYYKRRKAEMFLHRMAGGCVIPRLVVPTHPSQVDKYSTTINKFIREADGKNLCGWIIDLRGNGGGNVMPMLAGIGALLSTSDAIFGVDADEMKTTFFYRNGEAGLIEPSGAIKPITKIKGNAYKAKKQRPTAVLIDRGTGSSGEMIAVAFSGQAETRFFGEKSAGFSTVNQGFKLSDGANMVLTVAVFADRNGKKFPDGIEPDEKIPVGEKILPPGQDPLIHAALGWIGEQDK